MSVQNSASNSNKPFFISGDPVSVDNAVIKQDAARSESLLFGTIMAKISATGKWVPWTDSEAEDGSALPAGIYLGETILAATLVAGDVSSNPILVGASVTVDQEQCVVDSESDLTLLDDVVLSSVNSPVRKTARDWLAVAGIYLEATVESGT